MYKLLVILILSLAFAPSQGSACSDKIVPAFRAELRAAKNIFVFRLLTTKLVRKDGYAWAEGEIEIMHVMKGNAKNFKYIKFSTLGCGANNLHVGHEYLGLNSQHGLTFDIPRGSEAVIDLAGFYSPDWKDPISGSLVLNDVSEYIKGKPLPPEYPDGLLVSRTSLCPASTKQTKSRK